MLQYGSTVERSMEEESQGSKVFGCSLPSHPLDARRVGGFINHIIRKSYNESGTKAASRKSSGVP